MKPHTPANHHSKKGLIAKARRKLKPLRFKKPYQHITAGVFVLVFAAIGVRMLFSSQAAVIATWPTTPPAQICGTNVTTNPSSTMPAGAVSVPAGDNTDFFTQESYRGTGAAGTTYWFAPGTHTIGNATGAGQIQTRDNQTYIGAPGAIIDGLKKSPFAFEGGQWDGTKTADVTHVTIKYLTIQNFTPPQSQGAVNQDAGTYWEVAYNNISNNDDGAGMMIGAHNNVHHNCFDSNGQYAFNAYHAGDTVTDVIVDSNEIKNNNTADWETKVPGCGCTGGGKFWAVKRARVTNNWVHGNKSVGIWADFNNVEFLIDHNLVEDNDAQGVFYEISYNFLITNNNIRRNNIASGLRNQGEGFPYAAIYISESGGDTRAGSVYTTSEIHHNNIENNWDGVALWENSDRFCQSPFGGVQASCPFFDQSFGARNLTQNVLVHDNIFTFDKSVVGCTSENCGRNGIFSNFSSNTTYPGFTIADAITYNQNNHFTNNTYTGPWGFTIYDQGTAKGWDIWQKDPVSQDVGSTCPNCRLGGSVGGGSGGQGATFDADTATIEGTVGKWAPWFSTTVSRSTEQAHTGTASLKVDVTAPNGWGVQLSNWPGFAATPGNKTIGFWGKNGLGTLGATLNVRWRDASNADLQTDTISIPSLSTTWQQATKDVVAPTGTTTVYLELVSTSGGAGTTGNYAYFDDFAVGDRTTTDTQPPTSVTLTAPTTATGTVTLSSTAQDNVGVTKLEFYNGTTLLGSSSTPASGTASNGTWQYAWNTTTTPNGTYQLTSKAYDAANNATTSTPVSVSVNNATVVIAPATNLAATATSPTQVNLTWTASTSPTVTKYYVVRNGTTIAETGKVTSYSDTTASPSTQYNYQLIASDGTTSSVASNTATVTTPAPPDTTAPSVPGTPTASLVSASQVNVSWSPSTDTGGSGLKGYHVYRNGTKLTTTPVTGTSYGDGTVQPGQTYTYTVSAIDNASNESAKSAASNSITTPNTQTTITGKVTQAKNNSAISGATVKVTGNGLTRTTTTDTNGNYSLPNLPNATYTLTVTKKPYQASTQTVSLTGGTKTINVILQR